MAGTQGRRWAAALNAGGGSVRRRAAVHCRGKRVNAPPASVSSGDCTGSKRASQGIELRASGATLSAGAAARRRAAARDRRRGRAAAGKQGRGRKTADEYPYPTAVLLQRLFYGGE
jgi:hypothetical protein